MKNLLQSSLIAMSIISLTPTITCAQVPEVRSLGCFVLFTTTGAVGNTGTSSLSGNIGTGTGAITGFEAPTSVNGSFYNADAVTTQCSTDLALLCNEINTMVNTNTTHAPAFGAGETLTAGVYSVASAGSATGTLILDAQGNANAIFIFKFGGALTTAAGTTIILLNGAKASNIFWKANGAIAMAANTDMKGTTIANPGAISMGAGGTLSGRMLSTTGAVSVYMVTACSIGCTSCSPVFGVSTWKGNDHSWNNTCNWCGGIPTANTNVEIPASLNYYPIIEIGTAMSKDIHIESGASLIIKGSGIFSLYGAINNAGILNITDGTLNLAGTNVEVAGTSLLNSTVKNLTISSGALNAISSGANMLSVKNNVSFLNSNNRFTTNGNLTLLSSDTLTASLTDITNNGLFTSNSIEGNTSVERFIPALKRWRLLSINTEATTGSKNTVQQNWMEGATPGIQGNIPGRGLWVTASGYTTAPANFDAYTIAPSIKWLDGNSYTGITDPTNYDLRSHPSYFTYVRGDRGSTPANGIVSTTILRTYGRLIQGDKNTLIAAAPLYTSTGNPYASSIDLRKLLFSTNEVINIYVWDPNIGGSFGQGAYQHLSKGLFDTQFSIEPGGGSYGARLTMNTIESGLGFMVQGTGSGRILSFKENAKTALVGQGVSRFSQSQQKIEASLMKEQTNGLFSKVDGLQIRMDSGYLTALDFDDARKFNSTTENIAVLREGALLTFEYRNLPEGENDTIKVNMANMVQKNYRWVINFENFDTQARAIFLVDKYLGTETLLNVNEINSIGFNVTATLASSATDRFIILLRQQTVLALNKIIPTVNRNTTGNVFVNWAVNNESNILNYQTEKSVNGNVFSAFGLATNPTCNNGGNSLYSKEDESNYNSHQYYRIKILNLDFSVHYSNIVQVLAVNKQGKVTIYPNPVQGKIIHLNFTAMPKGNYQYIVRNNIGQQISIGRIITNEESARITITLSKSIPAQNCTLTLIDDHDLKTVVAFKIIE